MDAKETCEAIYWAMEKGDTGRAVMLLEEYRPRHMLVRVDGPIDDREIEEEEPSLPLGELLGEAIPHGLAWFPVGDPAPEKIRCESVQLNCHPATGLPLAGEFRVNGRVFAMKSSIVEVQSGYGTEMFFEAAEVIDGQEGPTHMMKVYLKEPVS